MNFNLNLPLGHISSRGVVIFGEVHQRGLFLRFVEAMHSSFKFSWCACWIFVRRGVVFPVFTLSIFTRNPSLDRRSIPFIDHFSLGSTRPPWHIRSPQSCSQSGIELRSVLSKPPVLPDQGISPALRLMNRLRQCHAPRKP